MQLAAALVASPHASQQRRRRARSESSSLGVPNLAAWTSTVCRPGESGDLGISRVIEPGN